MSTVPLSNHVTEAANQAGHPTVTIRSHGTPEMTSIDLSDGRSLGLIQSATWSVSLTDYARATIETILPPADLKVLLRDTTILVRPAPGYNPFRYTWDWVCAWAYNLFTKPDHR